VQFKSFQFAVLRSSPPTIKFGRWNPSERIIQPSRAQLLWKDSWGYRLSIRADLGKPFRPSSAFVGANVLSPISMIPLVESFGRIQRAQEVRRPPGDKIRSIRGQIFHPTVTRISLEARALLLGQFPAHSDRCSLLDEFSSL
jgi:hypothetical protein